MEPSDAAETTPLEMRDVLVIETNDGISLEFEVVGLVEDDENNAYGICYSEKADEFVVTDKFGELLDDDELAQEILDDFFVLAEESGEYSPDGRFVAQPEKKLIEEFKAPTPRASAPHVPQRVERANTSLPAVDAGLVESFRQDDTYTVQSGLDAHVAKRGRLVNWTLMVLACGLIGGCTAGIETATIATHLLNITHWAVYVVFVGIIYGAVQSNFRNDEPEKSAAEAFAGLLAILFIIAAIFVFSDGRPDRDLFRG